MKKIIPIGLMVVGFVVIGLGGAMIASSDNQKYCEEFHLKAIALLDEAVKVKGTPREKELTDDAQSESEMAEQMCGYAAQTRQNAMLVAGGGLLLLVLGFVLSKRKPAAPAPPAN